MGWKFVIVLPSWGETSEGETIISIGQGGKGVSDGPGPPRVSGVDVPCGAQVERMNARNREMTTANHLVFMFFSFIPTPMTKT